MILLFLFSPQLWAFTGKVRDVEMKEHTQFSLNLVPHLGTRLIFPFLLDDFNLKPPLNYKLTNAGDFTVTRNLDALAGQNVFLITCSERKGRIGKLYMSIAGYNLAINLIISDRVEDHVSDIFFVLSEDDRSFLISQETERIKKQLQDFYKRRYDREQDITYQDVASLMMKRIRKKNIKRLYRGDESGFATADIFLDRFVYQTSLMYGLDFWIEHYGDKFSLNSIILRSHKTSGAEVILNGDFFCFAKSDRLDRCLYMTRNELLISDSGRLFITLTNDKDEILDLVY